MSDLLNRIDLNFDFVAEKLRNHTISEAGCWEYQGHLHEDGYGRFKIYVKDAKPQKRNYRAHRVAYAFYNGVDPGSMSVCHRCDNPKCINPDHLFLGTISDNMRDMHSKGRAARQDGSHNGASKLTEAAVIQVVGKIRQGLNNKEIAAALPVTHSAVSLIRLGKAWKGTLEAIGYGPGEQAACRRRAA